MPQNNAHISQFMDHLRARDRSPTTLRAYWADMGIFGDWFEDTNDEAMTPQRVTPLDVRDYKSYLQTVKGYQPSTVNRKLAALKSFFTWAVDSGLVEFNPASGIKMLSQVRTAPRWLERVEQRDLVRELQIATQVAKTEAARFRARRDRAMLLLMLHAGLRVSEVSGLKKNEMTLNSRSGSVVVRADTAKGEKQRTVPLNASARKALRAWLEVRPAAGEPLFLSQRGGQLQPDAIYRRVKHYAQRAGMEEISPHTLRHTCAKNLVDRGVPLDRVAVILGHESLDTTAIYTQPSQADLAQEVEKIAWED